MGYETYFRKTTEDSHNYHYNIRSFLAHIELHSYRFSKGSNNFYITEYGNLHDHKHTNTHKYCSYTCEYINAHEYRSHTHENSYGHNQPKL